MASERKGNFPEDGRECGGSWNSACILFLDPEDTVCSSQRTEALHPRRVNPHELNLYNISESCFRAFTDCMSFSRPGSGVPLTNILPKAVLPLTDVSDSYGTGKPTSLSQQASCAEITAKLLFFFSPLLSQNRAKGGESRATNKRKEGVDRNHKLRGVNKTRA